MIGYYVHHQGYGHLARAMSICARLRHQTTALSSLQFPATHPFDAVVELPRDDLAKRPLKPTAGGSFHWAPHHDNGFHARMDAVARWIGEARPDAFVTDVSVEIATFVRLLGVPVIVVALPGTRFDAPHLLAHRLADHIIAARPRELLAPSWLRAHDDKTSYVGGISRYDGRAHPAPDGRPHADIRVLVLAGAMEISVPRSTTAREHARAPRGRP